MTFIVGIKCKPAFKEILNKEMWAPQPNARLTTPNASLLDIGFIEPTLPHKAVAVFLEQIKEAMALLLS